MDKDKIKQLLDLISEAVGADGSWRDKRDMILAEAGDGDETNIGEFCAWFEEKGE